MRPYIVPTTTIDFGHRDLLLSEIVLSGRVEFDRARQLLTITEPFGESEVLSVDLTLEGYVTFPDELGPDPRILDTGCDYAAVGSVAARWAS